MSEERKIILEMLKEGKINTEEAEKLLDKSGNSQNSNNQKSGDINSKFLRIRVTEGEDTNVNVNIPIALAEVGLQMVPKDKLQVNGKAINLNDIIHLIEEGTEGELVNIEAFDKGKETKVKIYID